MVATRPRRWTTRLPPAAGSVSTPKPSLIGARVSSSLHTPSAKRWVFTVARAGSSRAAAPARYRSGLRAPVPASSTRKRSSRGITAGGAAGPGADVIGCRCWIRGPVAPASAGAALRLALVEHPVAAAAIAHAITAARVPGRSTCRF